MRCARCGGRVEWRGWRFGNFTHTECMACGGHNCQETESTDNDDDAETEQEPSK